MVLLPYDRYQRLLSKDERSTPEAETSDVATVSESRPSQELISSSESLLQQFPKSMQHRVRGVLSYTRPHMSWNDRGEVTLEDKEIPGSNIVDLIKVHVKDYKNFHPPGKEAFGKLLVELNVPTSLLATDARQQSGRGQLPPPPGKPVKRHVETSTSKKVKWRRL